jgi:hypothetical protein
MSTGRPTVFTQEAADLICEEIATSSKSLRTICNNEFLPCVATVLKWLRTNESFLAQYTRAKEEQADFMAEEMIDIADDGTNDTIQGEYGPLENKEWTNRSKLRVETRKWIAAKLKPKKYGDKVDLTSGGDKIETAPIIIQGKKFADKDGE